MKRLLWCIAAVVVGTISIVAQEDVRVITRPAAPSREILERLSMEVAWRTQLKFQGGRDGMFSVQLIPRDGTPEILVQTRKGAVLLFDAETGDLKWRTPLEGKVLVLAGFNSQSIFAARGDQLYVLNRKTGMHRVYSKQEGYPEPVMGYRLPDSPSAPLTADNAGLFVAMGQRVTAYVHPDFERALEAAKQERDKNFAPKDPEMQKPDLDPKKVLGEVKKILEESPKTPVKDEGTSLQPFEVWNYYTSAPAIFQAPLTTFEKVCVVTSAGDFLTLNRFESRLTFDFKTQGNVSAPMGQYGLTAYVGSDDFTLYAVNMHADKIVWRLLAGAPIVRKPEVTDTDVYVTAGKFGMYRVVRETGERVWMSERADQFLSANPKFVYARDRQGYLLILDALRGTTLAAWDARDWPIGIANEWNDRVYLAAEDGQIVCLRHRDLPTPHKSRTFITLRKEDLIKPAEPKKDDLEKKDQDKKDEKKEDKKEQKKKDKKEEKKKDEKKEEKKKDDADAEQANCDSLRGAIQFARWERREIPVVRALDSTHYHDYPFNKGTIPLRPLKSV